MPQTLAEKIAEVGKSIPNLAKKGGDENSEYRWLTAVDVFEAVRGKLFEKGIMIYPQIMECVRSQPYLSVTDDITDEVMLKVKYIVTDGENSIECSCMGIGQDHEGKALYIASTGAKKDLLKSLFLIAGYEDDAEAQTNVERIPPGLAEKLDAAEKEFGSDLREHPIDRIKVNAFTSACRTSKIGDKQKREYLIDNFNVEKISDLKRKNFDQAIKWATNTRCIVCGGPVETTPRVIVACDACINKDPELSIAP